MENDPTLFHHQDSAVHSAQAVCYASREAPCPYLAGRFERQVYIELRGTDSPAVMNHLNRFGFRRSHHLAYRPICRNCTACISARLRVFDLRLSKSFRRCLNANHDLVATTTTQSPTEEHFLLFQAYLEARHPGGGMNQMTREDFDMLVQSTSVDSSLLELRRPDGSIAGAALYDNFSDGLSAVYSFFDPREHRKGLGNFLILTLAELARTKHLPYLYLGYYVEGSPKMQYKAMFRPLEGFVDGTWRTLFA